MEKFLVEILDHKQLPFVTAFILGLLTAISPCPLATNITAVGYISRDIKNRNRVFLNGLLYTAGRAITYLTIAMIIFFGVDQFRFSGFFQQYGEKFIGPLLFLIGLFMLDIIKVKFPSFDVFFSKLQLKTKWGSFEAILLGLVFALAFCPYSGVIYFGMLIPMTITSAAGLYLPVVFALATGIPVIVAAWVLAYSVSGIGNVYNRIKLFETWFRRLTAIVFIAAGAFYIYRIYL